MNERFVKVDRISDVAAGTHELRISLEADLKWEIFPVGIAFPAEVKEVVIKGKGGDLVFASEEVEHDPMLLVFCHLDGQISIRSDGEIRNLQTYLVEVESGEAVEGGATELGEGYITALSNPVSIDMPPGRLIMTVEVVKPSQLSLDLFKGDAEHAHSSVTIAFDEAWANVYRDIFNEGIYSPDKRVKSGYFPYEPDEKITLLMQREEGGLRINVSSSNRMTPMREMELPDTFDRIEIRESASSSGGQGAYSIEVL